jgi:hypothetical protein
VVKMTPPLVMLIRRAFSGSRPVSPPPLSKQLTQRTWNARSHVPSRFKGYRFKLC